MQASGAARCTTSSARSGKPRTRRYEQAWAGGAWEGGRGPRNVPAVPSSCVDAAAAGVPAVGRPCRRDPAASQWARHFSSGEMTLPFRFSSQSFVSTLVLLLVVGLWQWPKGCTAARKAGLRCVDAAGRRCVLSFDHAVAD